MAQGAARLNRPLNAGGIIPNLARNLHSQNIMMAMSECIEQLEGKWDSIDAIALTVRPGLEMCLWEGLKVKLWLPKNFQKHRPSFNHPVFQFTKLLLQKYKKPFIPIHHMEAHALTPRLFDENLKFPYLTLLISGGNTLIGLVSGPETFMRFGQTKDHAIGCCIDKVARSLGLFQRHLNEGLCGGQLIETHAKVGDPQAFEVFYNVAKDYCSKSRSCEFSFSGLMNTAFNIVEKELKTNGVLSEKFINDACASFQHAVALVLKNRLERAIVYYSEEMGAAHMEYAVISGGVASNRYIFEVLRAMCASYGLSLKTPPIKYCTDNGVMIAWNGCEKLMCDSKQIVSVAQQSCGYMNSVRPEAICELGPNIDDLLRKKQIKLKF